MILCVNTVLFLYDTALIVKYTHILANLDAQFIQNCTM
jgi:hypothetical protein